MQKNQAFVEKTEKILKKSLAEGLKTYKFDLSKDCSGGNSRPSYLMVRRPVFFNAIAFSRIIFTGQLGQEQAYSV